MYYYYHSLPKFYLYKRDKCAKSLELKKLILLLLEIEEEKRKELKIQIVVSYSIYLCITNVYFYISIVVYLPVLIVSDIILCIQTNNINKIYF